MVLFQCSLAVQSKSTRFSIPIQEIGLRNVSLWLPYGIGQTIIFWCCGFYLLSSFS